MSRLRRMSLLGSIPPDMTDGVVSKGKVSDKYKIGRELGAGARSAHASSLCVLWTIPNP